MHAHAHCVSEVKLVLGNAPMIAQWPISSKRGEVERATVHFWRKDEHLGSWADYFW